MYPVSIRALKNLFELYSRNLKFSIDVSVGLVVVHLMKWWSVDNTCVNVLNYFPFSIRHARFTA